MMAGQIKDRFLFFRKYAIWSTVAVGRQKRNPADFGLRGIFMPIMSGAEGQSRTDTGSPSPVFESGENRID